MFLTITTITTQWIYICWYFTTDIFRCAVIAYRIVFRRVIQPFNWIATIKVEYLDRYGGSATEQNCVRDYEIFAILSRLHQDYTIGLYRDYKYL